MRTAVLVVVLTVLASISAQATCPACPSPMMTANPATQINHYSVKVQVAHPGVNWPSPIRWATDVYAPDLTSAQHYYACSLAVIPYAGPPTYAPPFPEGPIEFPGHYLDETGSPLAAWCFWDAQPGDCARVDVKELVSPDLFGHRYVVTRRQSC